MNPLYQKNILERTKQVITERLSDTNFTIEELCREVGYSYPHLYRMIKAESGLSLSHYVRQQRLLVAIDYLKEASMNITEISFAVGFKDPNYFIRVFRLKYKVTPRKWRAAWRQHNS